jgi:uncharacterized membrane protein YhaH (DUF805 family)
MRSCAFGLSAMDVGFAWYFLSLKGRISRQEFWLGQSLLIVLALLLAVKLTVYFVAMRQPANGVWNPDDLDLTLALPFYFLSAALFWPMTAIAAKRLHDMNMSAWWVLAALVVSYGSAMFNNCSLAFPFIATVMLAGLPHGTRGRNRFGADPLAPQLA